MGGGGEGGVEVWEEEEYIPIATLSPPEWPALRGAAMRAILMFHQLWGTKSQDRVPNHNFWRKKKKEKKDSQSGIEPILLFINTLMISYN